jgi:hypothetical protein
VPDVFEGESAGVHLNRLSQDTPFEMHVDRPFLVAVIERETDLSLFVRVIGDPTPSE